MRRRFALIHPVLLLALAAQPAFPQTSVGTAWMVPWIDSSGAVTASSFSFDDAGRGISLDALFIDFPPLAGTQSDIPLPPGVLSMTDATVPAVRASFSRPLGSLSVSAGIGAFSFPERKTVIEKQTLRIRSDTGWIFDAGVRFRSLSVHSVFAYDSALLFAGGTPVGSADVSFGGIALSWNGISAFWLRGEVDASVSAHLRYTPTLGFSLEGSAKGGFSAYGGAADCSFKAAGGLVSVFACAGLLGPDSVGTQYLYAYNETGKRDDPSFSYDRDPFFVLRAGYKRRFALVWVAEVFRVVGWSGAPRISSSTAGSNGEGPGNQRLSLESLRMFFDDASETLSALDPATVLLAGSGISVRLDLR